MQPRFSNLLSLLVMLVPVLAMAMWLRAQPSRHPDRDRVVSGEARAVAVAEGLRGWRLSAPDPRFGGLSALAMHCGQLIALTDSGVVVRFTPPSGTGQVSFALHDLPGGPGSPSYKAFRDSESLLADPAGRGWWVGFETRHSLWLFDRGFAKVLGHWPLNVDWLPNYGGEALVARGNSVMVLPELGGKAALGPMIAPPWTSDATRLADGRIVLLQRRPTWRGFDLALRIGAGAGKPAMRIALDLGALDNMEGIAAAPLPNGGTRLWIVSDDNFRPWMRTLLVALDLPPGA